MVPWQGPIAPVKSPGVRSYDGGVRHLSPIITNTYIIAPDAEMFGFCPARRGGRRRLGTRVIHEH